MARAPSLRKLATRYAAEKIAELEAEIERLRTRNEALLGLIEVAYCPVNGKARVRDCQQCGCSAGLFLKDEQKSDGKNG